MSTNCMTQLAVAIVRDPELQQTSTVRHAVDIGLEVALEIVHLSRRPGESVEQLMARLGPLKAAELESSSIQMLDSMSDAGRQAVLFLLYSHLVSGRWALEARRASLGGDFRSYIYWLLLNPDRPGGTAFKRTEVSRLVDVCLLTQQLYLKEGGCFVWRRRLGLDDSVLPATPEELLVRYGDRLGRIAYSLLSLAREIGSPRQSFADLQQLVREGRLDPADATDGARLWRLITRWRFIFGIAADLSQPARALDVAASSSEQLSIPPLVIDQDVTPAQRLALRRLPFVVLPSDGQFGVRLEVRYQLELIPVCPTCEPLSICAIRPSADGTNSFTCPACGAVATGDSYTERWWVQWQTEDGMTDWFLTARPELEDWTPSLVTVAGVRSVVYTTWQDPAVTGALEEQFRGDTHDAQV